MLTIITVVLVISFLVFVHELGHFLAARLVGVRVLEFSIGFPPKIISRVIGKTEYILSAIPIGGYVRLHGQNIDDENPSEPDNYAAKSILQRLAILIAGPLMNLAVAFLLMPLVYFIGYDIPAYMLKPPVINAVKAGSTAERIDIKAGDIILSVNGTAVKNWREVQTALAGSDTDFIKLKIKRKSEIVSRMFSSSALKQGTEFGWKISSEPVIGDISYDSPAEKAGLMKGDRILAISGTRVDNWSNISPLVQKMSGKEIGLKIERDGRILDLKLKPDWNKEHKYWIIGISAQTVRVSEPFLASVSVGVKQVATLFIRTMDFLYQLVSLEADTDSVGGPIMIAQMVGKAAKTNLGNLISLVAFISLQFAIFNLLPIPALDGGHIFFLAIEKIKGGALSKGFRISIQKIGFTLLISLIIYISIKDSIRIFG